MRAKLLIEIEHVAMSVALAQNRDEAKDPATKAESFAECLNQSFARKFARPVQRRLHRKRRALRRGEYLRLAINRARRSKNNSRYTVGAHGFQHIERGDRVLLEIPAWVLRTETDVGIGCEVK